MVEKTTTTSAEFTAKWMRMAHAFAVEGATCLIAGDIGFIGGKDNFGAYCDAVCMIGIWLSASLPDSLVWKVGRADTLWFDFEILAKEYITHQELGVLEHGAYQHMQYGAENDETARLHE